jgi:sulfate adenylyltransferase
MEHSAPSRTGDARRVQELTRASRDWPSWTLTPRQLADLELLLNGGYAPLDRFMTRLDRDACAKERRLADGTPFPAPILLEVSPSCASQAAAARRLVLRDQEGVGLAVLDVADSWRDTAHYLGGTVSGLQWPQHLDAIWARHTPAEVAREIRRQAWTTVAAFPTRGIIHRAEHEATAVALAGAGNGLVVIALSDPTEDDGRRLLRLQCLEAVAPKYAPHRPLVWLVPLPRRQEPVDDLLLAAVVARNAGCTALIVTDVLPPDAIEVVSGFTGRLGMAVTHAPIPRGGGEALAAAAQLPQYDTFPEVARTLAARLPSHRRGFTVFFTGLSGSGKSTIANLVRAKLLERTGRPVTLLDGDVVRQHLSSELGFSREHRALNVRRIGFVAAEITRHGGMAICAPIAPYESMRLEARRAIEAVGGFVLVFVDTPLETCEARDRKGLYAKARAGLIGEFTGVSDPYERPADAEIVIETARESAQQAAGRIVAYLEQHGYLSPGGAA